MIVFISDLHLVDETAGKHNVPARAFELFMGNLRGSLARRKNIKDLQIVLLGDIFDVLRTERWHIDAQGNEVARQSRPWGEGGIADQAAAMADPSKTDSLPLFKHTLGILEDILDKNADRLEVFRAGVNTLSEAMDRKVKVHYIPGNHDRLINFSSKMRGAVRQCLGMPNSKQPFKYFLHDKAHRVFAQHGHEYDPYNYEGGTQQEAKDYLAMPIGDPITTELISRIPQVIAEKAKERVPTLTPGELATLKRNFQDIENVRPFTATIEWLLFQVKKLRPLRRAIEDAIDLAITDFNDIPYVEDWMQRHDVDGQWDEADKIQLTLGALKMFKVLSMGNLMGLANKIKGAADSEEPYRAAASWIMGNPELNLRIVLFGHTHDPAQNALRLMSTAGSPEKKQIYLNTGTWRPRQHRCQQGSGFMQWKSMTYSTVYKPKERPGFKDPVFDVWTGQLG